MAHLLWRSCCGVREQSQAGLAISQKGLVSVPPIDTGAEILIGTYEIHAPKTHAHDISARLGELDTLVRNMLRGTPGQNLGVVRPQL